MTVVVGGRWQLEEESASGGMGVVFRARDLTAGETVAIKLMHRHGLLDVDRWEREAQILAGLSHPGIVRYIDHGVHDDRPFLVTEWIDGTTLSGRLLDGFTAAEAVAVVIQIADALGAAHGAGVVHRDVKPSNVLFPRDGDGRAKLIDFGLARGAAMERLTRTGVMLGTPGYMAPEQVRGGRDVDARADVFALGCVLYQCLGGRAPFRGDDTAVVQAKILLAAPPPIGELAAGLAPGLLALLDRMLAKDPGMRPANASVVAEELRGLPAAAPGPALIHDPERSNAERATTLVAGGLHFVITALTARDHPWEDDAEAAALRRLAARHGARLECMVEGTVVATLDAGAGSEVEGQAARAVELARALRDALPDAPMAVCAGLGPSESRPIDALLEHALAVLETEALATLSAPPGALGIRLDDAAASLIGVARLEPG